MDYYGQNQATDTAAGETYPVATHAARYHDALVAEALKKVAAQGAVTNAKGEQVGNSRIEQSVGRLPSEVLRKHEAEYHDALIDLHQAVWDWLRLTTPNV